MWQKIVAVLTLLIIAGYLFIKFSNKPDPFPPSSASASFGHIEKFEISSHEFVLRDASRQTQAHQYAEDFEGLPYRDFKVTVWAPRQKIHGGSPLIVYSHGLLSSRDDAGYLARHLSSNGYIVMAADFPLTSRASGKALNIADVVNQPRDLSFLIDQITSDGTEIGTLFSERLDPNRIGVLGYSLGGLTSTLAAYHPDMKEPRIRAVASLAGPSAMLGETFYRNNDIPFMMVAGTLDAVVPHDDHATVILDRIGNSVLVSIAGGTHMGFAGMSRYMRWLSNPDTVMCGLMNYQMERRGLERGEAEKAWYPLIGSTTQGVIHDDSSLACPPDDAPAAALNPLKQQMLTKIAVLAFFDSVFDESDGQRERAWAFLVETLPLENPEVEVRSQHTDMH